MQQGIQSLHATVELFVENKDNPEALAAVYDWAENHKTVRILSAGGGDDYEANIEAAIRVAQKYQLPWASFTEPDLFNKTTAFAMIVTPEMVFEVQCAQESLEAQNDVNLDAPEGGHGLAQFLSEFPSAR